MPKTIKTLLLSASIITLTLAPAFALAAANMGGLLNEAGSAGGYDTSEAMAQTGPAMITGIVARIFISLLGVLFLSYTIYGGYLWLTAAGNQEKVTKATHIIRDGVIGICIVLGAAAIYALVAQYLLNVKYTS